VNQACGEHEGTKREELSLDAGNDQGALAEAFNRVRASCLNEKRLTASWSRKTYRLRDTGRSKNSLTFASSIS
jgi:hypothetical protein